MEKCVDHTASIRTMSSAKTRSQLGAPELSSERMNELTLVRATKFRGPIAKLKP